MYHYVQVAVVIIGETPDRYSRLFQFAPVLEKALAMKYSPHKHHTQLEVAASGVLTAVVHWRDQSVNSGTVPPYLTNELLLGGGGISPR